MKKLFTLEKEINLACGQTYITKTIDGHLIEMGDVFMSIERKIGTRPYEFSKFESPADTEKRVMTISTMIGCTSSCKFCASSNSFVRNLSAEEIVGQVEFMIEQGIIRGRNNNPNNSKEFRVLFTRMGEPLVNHANVVDAIIELKSLYPHIIVGMSTSGYDEGFINLINTEKGREALSCMDFQFSVHSTSDEERKQLFGRNNIIDIERIMECVNILSNHTNKKIGLNFILFEGYTYDFKSLLKYAKADKFWIRLSPWNDVDGITGLKGLINTEDVIHKKPITSKELKLVIENLDESGISYSYAPAIDEEIKHKVACGQALEAFKKEMR